MASPAPKKQPDSLLLSPQKAAALLDMSVSNIHRMMRNGLLTRIRIGTSVRVRADEIEALARGEGVNQ